MANILIVRSSTQDANPKGYNVQEMGLAKALCQMGHDVDWVALKSKDHHIFEFFSTSTNKCTCYEVPRLRLFRWAINTKVARKSFLKKYDIVICFEYWQYMTYLLAKNMRKGILYSGPYYNLFFIKCISPIFDVLFTRTINNRFSVKFVKSVLAKDFLEKKGYTDIQVAGVGLDTTRFKLDVPILPETQKLIHFMSNNKCLLYVGALSDRKNYPFLLKIYKQVHSIDHNIKFVIIGKSVISPILKLVGFKDVDYAERYNKSLTSSERNGIIHIEKINNEQLKYIYPLAKAFLLPSKLEIFGMVLLEAMYFGAPVISSPNGGSLTVIKDNDCGLIVDKFNPTDWCNSIFKYIDDEELAHRHVRNARKLLEEKYNWHAIAKAMLNSFYSI